MMASAIDFGLRAENRRMAQVDLLAKLKASLPDVFPFAEVVGGWVWATLSEKPSAEARMELSQLGFHWNNKRRCWQHPCGRFTSRSTSGDPREKYGHCPAEQLEAA